MDEWAWNELGSLSRPLEQALRAAFKRPALVALSVEDEASAKGIVSEAIGANAGVAEHGRLGTALLVWAQKHRRLEGRLSTEVVSSVYKHGTASEWFKQPGMGDHYETLVRASPKLALDAFEKTLQAQKKGRLLKEGSADREEKQKTKWALTLAAIIEEADLPAAARIKAGDVPEKLWVRAFGNRRSKTLRGRALMCGRGAWRHMGPPGPKMLARS